MGKKYSFTSKMKEKLVGFSIIAGLAVCLSAPGTVSASEIDTEAPVFSGVDTVEMNLSDVASFDPKKDVKATDAVDGVTTYVLKGKVVAKGGIYKLKYSATDKSRNEVLVTRTVIVNDDVAPVFKGLTSSSAIGLSTASRFNPTRSVSAIDSTDGRVTFEVDGEVKDEVGEYVLTYTATDKSGNEAVFERTIEVYDNVKPTFEGIPTKTEINLSDVMKDDYEFIKEEDSFSANDTTDGDDLPYFVSGEVGTTVGTYRLTYSAVDEAGNIGTFVRRVVVVDDIFPKFYGTDGTELTELPSVTLTVEEAKKFNAKTGITAIDNVDGNRAYSVKGRVSATPGTYTLTYTVRDKARNETTLTRTVTVN